MITATSRAKRSRRRMTAKQQEAVRSRTEQLLRTEIEFIPNPEFRTLGEEEDALVEARLRMTDPSPTAPPDLPAHLRRMCDSQLLSQEEETALFRQMNYLKCRANALRSRLDARRIDPEAVAKIDSLLEQAAAIRDHIIKSNMRLVMSIVKKFVTPQHSFDEMLSDGIVTLMQAVEKFDYDRGFRFSTYAYRSIARSACRQLTATRKEEARVTRNVEDWAFEQEDGRRASSMNEEVWSHLREAAGKMLDRLDRREKFIVRSRYALGGHRKVRTFQYLADKLGVSKERVRQLEQRAVEKLRCMAAELEVDELPGAAML